MSFYSVCVSKSFPRHPEVLWPQQENTWKIQVFFSFPKAGPFLRTNFAFYDLFFPQDRRWTDAFSSGPPVLCMARSKVFSHLSFVISLSAFNGCLTPESYSQQALFVIASCCLVWTRGWPLGTQWALEEGVRLCSSRAWWWSLMMGPWTAGRQLKEWPQGLLSHLLPPLSCVSGR